MNHSARLPAVKVAKTDDRLGVVKLNDKSQVFKDSLLAIFLPTTYSIHLPVFPLVFTQVQDFKGLAVWNIQQTLSGSVNGKPPQIAANPPPAQLLSHCQCCPRAAKKVSDKVVLVGRCRHKNIKQSFWLLSVKTQAL